MKIILIVTLFLFSLLITNAQSILNGSFEDNNANDCNVNFYIYGLSPSLQNFNVIYSDGSCRLLNNIYCNCNSASDGNWYLKLYSDFVGYGFESMLNLSSPLIAGNLYTISYDYLNPVDTILQSSYSDTLEMGYSDTLNLYNIVVTDKFYTNSTSWQTHTFSFTPSINARYLTLGYGSFGSSFNIDNIRIVNTLNVSKVQNMLKPTIYPNPCDNYFTINNVNLSKFIDLSIYSLDGILITKQFSTKNIDVEFLAKGYYILEVKNSDSIERIKFLKD